MTVPEKKTYRQYVEEALDAEKNMRWSDAAALWDDARRASKTKAGRAEAAGKAAAAGTRAEAGRPPTIPPAPPPVDGRGDALEEYATEAKYADPTEMDRAEDDLHDGEFQSEDVPIPDPRATRKGLVLGQVLTHERRGKVLAECTYVGYGDWRFDGKSYTSISAAANAAAEKLGMKSRTLNGWLFWGVEKRVR